MAAPALHPSVNRKFHHDGSSKTFRGHTVICGLPSDSPLATTLRGLRQELSQHKHSDLFSNEALLPESSYHMTVFDIMCDQKRGANTMPGEGYATDIKERCGLTGPYEDWLEYSTQKVQAFVLPENMRPPYNMIIEKKGHLAAHGIELKLKPDDSAELGRGVELKLRTTSDSVEKLDYIRNKLAQQIGITPPSNYYFHLTLAYLLRDPTPTEVEELEAVIERHLTSAPAVVEFPRVDFCTFEDMQAFTSLVKF
jgi:hypothetical protein